mgnify:CR=1 FL=1
MSKAPFFTSHDQIKNMQKADIIGLMRKNGLFPPEEFTKAELIEFYEENVGSYSNEGGSGKRGRPPKTAQERKEGLPDPTPLGKTVKKAKLPSLPRTSSKPTSSLNRKQATIKRIPTPHPAKANSKAKLPGIKLPSMAKPAGVGLKGAGAIAGLKGAAVPKGPSIVPKRPKSIVPQAVPKALTPKIKALQPILKAKPQSAPREISLSNLKVGAPAPSLIAPSIARASSISVDTPPGSLARQFFHNPAGLMGVKFLFRKYDIADGNNIESASKENIVGDDDFPISLRERKQAIISKIQDISMMTPTELAEDIRGIYDIRDIDDLRFAYAVEHIFDD